MPLDPTERLAVQDAVRIANTILAGGGDAQSVAVKLTWLAQHLCGDDLHARYALAWQMLDAADELMDLPRVEAGPRNGYATLGSR